MKKKSNMLNYWSTLSAKECSDHSQRLPLQQKSNKQWLVFESTLKPNFWHCHMRLGSSESNHATTLPLFYLNAYASTSAIYTWTSLKKLTNIPKFFSYWRLNISLQRNSIVLYQIRIASGFNVGRWIDSSTHMRCVARFGIFAQFKKQEKNPRRSVTFSKVAGFSLQLY